MTYAVLVQSIDQGSAEDAADASEALAGMLTHLGGPRELAQRCAVLAVKINSGQIDAQRAAQVAASLHAGLRQFAATAGTPAVTAFYSGLLVAQLILSTQTQRLLPGDLSRL
jgi:hypothetical protein